MSGNATQETDAMKNKPSVPQETHSCCAAHAQGEIPEGAECPDQTLKRGSRIVHNYALIDELLDARRAVFGGNDAVFSAYRGHVYRMFNFARQWTPASAERDDKIAICAAFHDIAAWPDDNLDYLHPSADQADAYLEQSGRSDWKPEMRLMIESHHKITAYTQESREWVEPIRRADWCDISFALFRFGLPKAYVQEVRQAFPIAAFYPNHVLKVSLKWMLRHPLNPVPILRW